MVRRGGDAIVRAMLADLIRRLAGPPAPRPARARGRAARRMAALMVRISRTDGSYSDAERRRIDAMLASATGSPRRRRRGSAAEAEIAEAGAQDTVQFTRLIKEAVPYEERTGVVEALWRVAAADGINADEHGLMRLVANLLGVSDVDSGLARQRALRESPQSAPIGPRAARHPAIGPLPGQARQGRDQGPRGPAGHAARRRRGRPASDRRPGTRG